jgi:hypothetical protein
MLKSFLYNRQSQLLLQWTMLPSANYVAVVGSSFWVSVKQTGWSFSQKHLHGHFCALDETLHKEGIGLCGYSFYFRVWWEVGALSERLFEPLCFQMWQKAPSRKTLLEELLWILS